MPRGLPPDRRRAGGCARKKGILHRDLKPANLKVTPEGKVKILDFGLAKAFQGDAAATDASKSPTLTDQMTRPGVILGTAAYMSPEQAKGRAVDKRADIWAFGCILYECLAGRRPFEGETVTETLASILKGEPDWQNLPAEVPQKIRDLIRRCLRKDPRERLHDVADAKLEIGETCAEPFLPAPAAPARPSLYKLAAAVAALAVVLTAASVIIWRLAGGPSPAPVSRSIIELPEGMWLTSGGFTQIAPSAQRLMRGPVRKEIDISPDGRHLAFSASPDGYQEKAMLYLRALDTYDAKAIPGTEGARMPFFSPDGDRIAYWAQQKLMKVPLAGGLPSEICACEMLPAGVHWGPEDRIVIGTISGGLQTVDARGGTLADLTSPDQTKEATHRLPHLLPNGKALIFTAMPHSWGTQAHIEAFDLETEERKPLKIEGADARYLPTGHLVYMKEGVLWAVRFDPEKLVVHGEAKPLVKEMLQALNEYSSALNSGSGQYSFSTSGSLIYASGGIFADLELQWYWVDRAKNIEPVRFPEKKPVLAVRFSPANSGELAYLTTGKSARIWLYDFLRGTSSRQLTPPEGRVNNMIWTPDGSRITFNYSTGGRHSIYEMAAHGISSMKPPVTDDRLAWPCSWSRDGKSLAYISGTTQTGRDIRIFHSDTGAHEPFGVTNQDVSWPEISPDGRWLAYGSRETQTESWEIWIASFPKVDTRSPISRGGGVEPLWSPEGRELYYWNPERTRLMAVRIDPSTGKRASAPEELFKFPYQGDLPHRFFDLSPDGKRFLIPEKLQTKPVEVIRLNFVQNWSEEVKRRFSAGQK